MYVCIYIYIDIYAYIHTYIHTNGKTSYHILRYVCIHTTYISQPAYIKGLYIYIQQMQDTCHFLSSAAGYGVATASEVDSNGMVDGKVVDGDGKTPFPGHNTDRQSEGRTDRHNSFTACDYPSQTCHRIPEENEPEILAADPGPDSEISPETQNPASRRSVQPGSRIFFRQRNSNSSTRDRQNRDDGPLPQHLADLLPSRFAARLEGMAARPPENVLEAGRELLTSVPDLASMGLPPRFSGVLCVFACVVWMFLCEYIRK